MNVYVYIPIHVYIRLLFVVDGGYNSSSNSTANDDYADDDDGIVVRVLCVYFTILTHAHRTQHTC